MRYHFITVLFGVTTLSFFLSACTPAIGATDESSPSISHVIILGFDGWGAESFEKAEMPFLKSMMPKSAWTLKKRSILPTSSACNWASMFKGVGPEGHGYIEWNTSKPAFDVTQVNEKGFFPSFFSIYRKEHPDWEMGYLYQWDGMKYIFEIEDFNYVKGYTVSVTGSDKMKDAAVSYIIEKKPAVAAFIWDYPDKIGHTIGWYSDDYMKELTHVDNIIEAIVKACVKAGIIDDTLFVITSDHGGHDKTHGAAMMSDLETPFFLFGKGVTPSEINVPLMQYDVAAMLADYSSLKIPASWRGKVPEGVFEKL